MEKIKVVLVDDHKIIRDGLKALIGEDEGIAIVGEASNGVEAIELIKNVDNDVVLMDINMPNMSGVETTKKILKIQPNTKVIALTMHNEEAYIIDMLKIGSMGYLLKEGGRNELIRAIKVVHSGEQYLGNKVSVKLINNFINGTSKMVKKARINEPAKTLTEREKEILELIVKGLTSQDIAVVLKISKRTVEAHRRNLFQKVGVKNSAALVNYAFEHNLI